jgi:uncharacterized membrane protein YidH (DUF202 family)
MPAHRKIPENPVPASPGAALGPIRSGGDGTRQLLQWGASILGAGFLAAVLLETVLGGFSPTGAHTNAGWLALIVALMCLPFGSLLLALGVAKWLRNLSIARRRGVSRKPASRDR